MSKQQAIDWLKTGRSVVLSVEEGEYGQEIENLAKVVECRKGVEVIFFDRGRIHPLYSQVGGFVSMEDAASWLVARCKIIRISEEEGAATIAPVKRQVVEIAECERCIFFCREINFCAVAPSFLGKPGCPEATFSAPPAPPAPPKLKRLSTALTKALEAVGF